MRKVLIALVILAVGLSGLLIWHCSGIEMESNQVRIGVTVYQMEDPFIAQIPHYIEKIAKEYEEEHGVRVFVDVVDAMGNQNLQNDQVSQFLDRNFDVLCVNMVDRTAAGSIVDKAMQADVPVVFFNREPVEEDMRRWDKLYYVCSKADESGVLEGGIVVDAYQAQPERWDKNGDGKLQYVLLEGEQGHQDSLIRTEVTIKTITDAGIELDKLAGETADWQRAQAGVLMEQWVQEFGDQIERVISNNDNMALGALDTYAALGIEELPMIVGIDAIQPALDAVRAGRMTGTVLNDAKGQAQAIFDLAYPLAQGRDPVENCEILENRYVWVSHQTVTTENLEEIVALLQ